MSFAIMGLGTALPAFTCTQEQAVRVAQALCHDPRGASLVPTLYRQTEIEQRHIVLGGTVVSDIIDDTRHSQSVFLPKGNVDDRGPTTHERMQAYAEHAPSLAMAAACQALDESKLAATEITHLVTVSCTGFSAPGVDIALIKGLKLRSTVERTHIGFMGCHGALNGLRLARAITGADPASRVLLCAVELCSLHCHYGSDARRLVGNALFGDGAAAVIGMASEDATADCWQVTATGAGLFPDSAYAMTWHIGDYGFDMTLSARVPNLIEKHLRPWLEKWVQQNNLRLDDIASWAIHPGGPRVLNAVADAVRLPEDALADSREVLRQHGNMSSPTVLFIIDRLRRRNAQRPCVAMGFGPGLAVEATLFR
jgi:predicted naringenin-chalcone synthase